MSLSFNTLKSRGDFKALSVSHLKWVTPSMIVLGRFNTDKIETIEVGISLSRKVGHAVTRNKIRRRLREIFRSLTCHNAIRAGQYLVIGRKTEKEATFLTLEKDLNWALKHIYRLKDEKQ
ncbi:MAG: ribonuclease P protein component [Candidatus Nucleicultricaceae bacterium]